jgi:uncharacterized protein YecE (DUF72 family)
VKELLPDPAGGGAPPPLHALAGPLAALAAKGVYLGTSSWKYPGWCGQLYSPGRYATRGKFSNARFERGCLGEYAEVFPTVCVDAGYYRFPSEPYLRGLAAQVPAGFRFGFKVTEQITVKRFTHLPRYGDLAGKPNPHFLDADAFLRHFLNPLAAIRDSAGLVIFEFSHFYPSDYPRARDFVGELDRFLAQLPCADWQFGIEVRNESLLHPDYFACLGDHGVAHVYNSWTKMPPLGEQVAMPGSRTAPGFTGARLLLKPGRTYEQAVKAFQPYEKTAEILPDVREAAAALVRDLAAHPASPARGSFLFVNNRLEGNALNTIEAIVRLAAG